MILEAFANYSFDDDMKVSDLKNYYQDLKIPSLFTVGNKRLIHEELTVEGTDIIDFDKLLNKSFQLIVLRNNKNLIQQNWELLRKALPQSNEKSTSLNFKELKAISDDTKSGVSDSLLIDMVAVATEGGGVDVNFVDFGYVLGKLGELPI